MRKPRPLPMDQMIEWYKSGMLLREIADRLGSDEWQPYWIEHTGKRWQPSHYFLGCALKKAGCEMRNSSERAIDRHPAKKPWPMDQMIQWYSEGMSLQEIANILASDDWQSYWKEKIGKEYRPATKIVNKVMKKKTELRGRGAPKERNSFWTGGKILDKDGYVLVHCPEHPFATGAGYVREHRLVMEKMIGRYLTPNEVVHHRDECISNNQPDNLMLFATNPEHIRSAHSIRPPNQNIRQKKRDLKNARDEWWPMDLLRLWYVDNLLTVSAIAALLGRSIAETNRGLTLADVQFDGNAHRRWDANSEEIEQARQFLASSPPYPELDEQP